MKNNHLGRGLAALLGDAHLPSARDLKPDSIALTDLEPNPFQPRRQVDEGELAELADSIRLQGVLQPILARPHPSVAGRYQIVAGERRWRASRIAGLDSIPCLVRDLPDQSAAGAALVENIQRQDLNPVEEAEGCRRLIEQFGLTQEEVARAVGKSRSHVANTLRLLQLPNSVLQALQSGQLTAGHARAALACDDPAAAARIMVEQGLSVRQAEALARSPKKPVATVEKAEPAPRNEDPNVRALEASLTEELGMRVTIRSDGQRGALSLAFQTLDQLDWIVSRLGMSR